MGLDWQDSPCWSVCDPFPSTRLHLSENKEYFEPLCQILKENRITCTELSLDTASGWDKEQCRKLVELLKPEVVNMDSSKSDRFEALFHAKLLVCHVHFMSIF